MSWFSNEFIYLSPSFLFVCLFVFLRYVGFSLLWPLPLRSTGSGRSGSAAMAHGPSRSAACGTFPDRGTNPCPLHRQADSQPLRHQGSPAFLLLLAPSHGGISRRVLSCWHPSLLNEPVCWTHMFFTSDDKRKGKRYPAESIGLHLRKEDQGVWFLS